MATTHFENVDLLKSLMGGGRTQAPASRRPAPVAATATPPPPTAASRVEDGPPSHDTLGISPTPFPMAGGPAPKQEAPPPPPSSWAGTTTTTTTTHSNGGAPPPYQTHAPPTPPPAREAPQPPPAPAASSTGAGSVRTVSAPGSPALSLASLPGYEAQPPASPGTAATGGPSSPSPQASSGLLALFQVPVPLGGFREGPTAQVPRRQSAPAPVREPPPPALSPVTSVASFRSLVVAESGGGGTVTSAPISELEGDSCHRLAPRPASYSGGGGGGNGAGPRRLSSPLPQTGARHGGRSQLFVYKPRPAPTALAADVITESPADTLVFELDGAGVGDPQGAASSGGSSRVVESPEREEDASAAAGSKGEERPDQGSRSTADVSGGGSSQVPGRRNEVESAAWNRRTKMFQV